ncbi:MAG: hypothetical protein RBR16_01930 [Syntrophus sp. (in: bacteria)]|nr:hypothetical protein [Syntrophus sp. (in: bacteria)]
MSLFSREEYATAVIDAGLNVVEVCTGKDVRASPKFPVLHRVYNAVRRYGATMAESSHSHL